MKLTLGFSTCPNDTFIFDAMVNGRIDSEGLEFDYHLADVEELNRKAFRGDMDITKMSYYAFAYASKQYQILDSGSALGYRNGPLLISKQLLDPMKISEARIAIPGLYTTANMLFSIAWPEAKNKTEYLFSDIEKAVLDDEADAGLIIHETRFTYFRKGLHKVADMGEYWEKLTGLPIPLGTVVINRKVPYQTALKVNRIIRRSLEYAYHNAMASYDFVRANAREMDSNVMNSHIKLYVNKFTINLGTEGRNAITELFRIAHERGIIPEMPRQIFLTTP
ncbi:MAG: 1,4-dihydroxy-6-naphthoate synthase [Bacteroidales bacterium]|nr:1,4-dihydroxy-6-naphthoate synthase [Bacteroidales bacterium]MBN2634270.1 1,4-dihydroxy-6-naphthoate synthase [Bacteroidales bacterium]